MAIDNPTDFAKAHEIWNTFQKTHDLSPYVGLWVAVDVRSGDVLFGTLQQFHTAPPEGHERRRLHIIEVVIPPGQPRVRLCPRMRRISSAEITSVEIATPIIVTATP